MILRIYVKNQLFVREKKNSAKLPVIVFSSFASLFLSLACQYIN